MSCYAAKSVSSVYTALGVSCALRFVRNIKPQVRYQGCNLARIALSERHPKSIRHATSRYYCQKLRNCWKCGYRVDQKDIFCSKCKVLQDADKNRNYFDILGLTESYDLEPKELTTNFRNLQRLLHPDHFGNKEEEEKRKSADYSSLVNKAYSTLLHPLNRGIYMLELKGIKIEEGTKKMSPEFLMEIMERNEEVDDLKDIEEIKRLTQIYQEILQKLSREVGKGFKDGDLEKTKDILLKMKYFSNIESKLKLLRQKFGIID